MAFIAKAIYPSSIIKFLVMIADAKAALDPAHPAVQPVNLALQAVQPLVDIPSAWDSWPSGITWPSGNRKIKLLAMLAIIHNSHSSFL